MTEQEKLLKAKIPGEGTGIEVRRTLCDICTPGPQCGIDAYVKDGKVIKVEGTKGYPGSNGHLCTKGASNRQYLYREDRIRTPLRRTGPRGSGQFEPISWEEALKTIAEKLNGVKKEYGPEAVAWFTGYSKWYRPYLLRLVHSFGSLNYGTESSSCHMATEIAWKTVTGRPCRQDLANSKVFLGWACNPYMGSYPAAEGLVKYKENGGYVIIIDPRRTPTTEKIADMHLQLKPGTDGALALGMAKLILDNGWQDQPYIDKYVYGFEEYKAYVQQFDLDMVAEITGLAKEDIFEATCRYATGGPASIWETAAAITHHINGYNNYRAMIALQTITGNIDRRGGTLPEWGTYLQTACGFSTMEEEFRFETEPKDCKPKIGAERFPVWAPLNEEFQAMDMVRQIHEGTPYPLKALVNFGMNSRMFPEPQKMLDAFDELDFVASTDIFMTDVCKWSDIVLPVCTSFERSELKAYPGGFLTCTTPVIEPLYESRPDTEVICELARYLGLPDDKLTAGYEACMRFIISNLDVTLEELKAAPLPIKVKEFKPYEPGYLLEHGFETPTGKIELYSSFIEKIPGRPDLSPLPTYKDSFDGPAEAALPLTLVVGARLPNAIHSRLHDVPWARSLRKNPAADINPADAAQYGISEGDDIELFTKANVIRVKAHLTDIGLAGNVHMYHGYKEADGNSLVGQNHLDPYSGFPGYRQLRCGIRKVQEEN